MATARIERHADCTAIVRTAGWWPRVHTAAAAVPARRRTPCLPVDYTSTSTCLCTSPCSYLCTCPRPRLCHGSAPTYGIPSANVRAPAFLSMQMHAHMPTCMPLHIPTHVPLRMFMHMSMHVYVHACIHVCTPHIYVSPATVGRRYVSILGRCGADPGPMWHR